MALSMDEQRMLAEIERRLAAADPALATRLSAFREPSPGARFRSTRARVIASACTVVLLAAIAVTVYALLPFRAGTSKSSPARQAAATRTSASAPVRSGTP